MLKLEKPPCNGIFLLYSTASLKSFASFRQNKSKQWNGFAKPAKTDKQIQEVNISIGLMSWRENDSKVAPKRGKKIILGKDYKRITFYLCKNSDLTVKRKLESF